MKIRLLTYLLLLCPLILSGQNTERLDQEHGFMDLKILADLDTIPDFISIFKDPDAYESKYEFAVIGSQYSYNGEKYKEYAGVKINKLLLATTSVYITEIRVVFPHDSALYHYLEECYGPPTNNCIRVTDYESKKAAWTLCIWQGKNARLTMASKKYYQKKDLEDSEVPDYMYLRFTSLEGELLHKKIER